MKKILIIVCCCFAGGLGYIGYKTINPSPLEIDPINDISIEASGYDGDGEVKVNTDNIPYPSKRYVKKFYETISYTVSPSLSRSVINTKLWSSKVSKSPFLYLSILPEPNLSLSIR